MSWIQPLYVPYIWHSCFFLTRCLVLRRGNIRDNNPIMALDTEAVVHMGFEKLFFENPHEILKKIHGGALFLKL